MAKKPTVHVHGTDTPRPLVEPETPTQEVAAAAVNVADIVDELNRRLTVQKLTTLQRMNLFKAAGPELSQNEQWIGLAALAASCIAIDGDKVPKPVSRLQIEALVERLGDEGIGAVTKVYKETFGIGADEEDDTVTEAKN